MISILRHAIELLANYVDVGVQRRQGAQGRGGDPGWLASGCACMPPFLAASLYSRKA
jgi:hypothetical protein